MTRNDNTILNRKVLPERIKQMLDSEDLEIVKLGTIMMKEYIPKEFWYNVLEMFSYKGGSDYELLYVRKWKFSIVEDEINITPTYEYIYS